MSLSSDICYAIKARVPLIAVETYEENAAIEEITHAAKLRERTVVKWSALSGEPQDIVTCLDEIRRSTLDKDTSPEKRIVVMCDPEPYINDPLVQRALKEVFAAIVGQPVCVVLLGADIAEKIPDSLQRYIHVIQRPLPGYAELRDILQDMAAGLRAQVTTLTNGESINNTKYLANYLVNSEKDLVNAGLGLTRAEYRNVLGIGVVRNEISPDVITAEKAAIIKKSGVLEFYPPETDLNNVGGLGGLKSWVVKSKCRFSPEAAAFGLKAPRGVMLFGPPGTGKSLSVKAMGAELGMPLMRLDMGAIASQYYGESSARMRKALQIAETVSPCVLWLDEVEKLFGGTSGERHEETGRMLGIILTFMEECKKPVFVAATSNDHRKLPPEFLQRFERIFLVDAPSASECLSILQIHIYSTGRQPGDYDLEEIAGLAARKGFVGRELRNAVYDCLAEAFVSGKPDLQVADLKRYIEETTPMLTAKRDEVTILREWAKANAIRANDPREEDCQQAANMIEV